MTVLIKLWHKPEFLSPPLKGKGGLGGLNSSIPLTNWYNIEELITMKLATAFISTTYLTPS